MGQVPAATARDLAGEYVERSHAAFERAAGLAGLFEADLDLAGMHVRLRFAGEGLRDVLLPPFQHLAMSGASAPQLSISAFDGATSGGEAPAPAWEPLQAAPGTNPVVRLRSERFCVLAAAGSGAVTAAEPQAGQATYYVPDAGSIPSSERAAPLREALQLLMAPHGRWMTHAGAVGRKGRGVLLVGRGGSGKSTLALSCALAGMEIAADDYVLLETGPPRAHAMQSTAKLTEDSARRLGLDPSTIDPAGFEPTLEGPAKALVDIKALAPDRMRRDLEIVALIAPTPPPLTSPLFATMAKKDEVSSRGEPGLRPVSAAEGLRGLAPSTIVQSGFHGAAALSALGELVREVPSYALELSPDPSANAQAVDQLVGELG